MILMQSNLDEEKNQYFHLHIFIKKSLLGQVKTFLFEVLQVSKPLINLFCTYWGRMQCI